MCKIFSKNLITRDQWESKNGEPNETGDKRWGMKIKKKEIQNFFVSRFFSFLKLKKKSKKRYQIEIIFNFWRGEEIWSNSNQIYPKKFSKTNSFYGSFVSPIYPCTSSWTCIPSCCDGISFPLYWKRRDSLILIWVKLIHSFFKLNNFKKKVFFPEKNFKI